MKYSNTQKALLESEIKHGVVVADVVALFTSPARTEFAIVRQGQLLNFGVKTTDGIKRFVAGKGTRNSSNTEVVLDDTETTTIVGEPRTAPTVQKPTIILESKTHYSNGIVSNNAENPANAGLKAYTQAMHILKSNNLPVEHSFVCIFSKYILECAKDGDYNDK